MYEDNENRNSSMNHNASDMGSMYSSYEIPSHTVREPIKEKKTGGMFKKVITCMVLGLIFGGFGALGFFAVNLATRGTAETSVSKTVETTVTPTVTTEAVPVEEPEEDVIHTFEESDAAVYAMDVKDVVKEVMPSVVSIINQSTQEAMTFFGQRQQYESETSGSGIIVGESDTELLIVTNNHVADAANTLSIQFIDGTTAEATMKGADSDVDLAVVAIPLSDISKETLEQIKVATLGDSDGLEVGEPAIAIGNALGYGQSVTTGVISALDREITIDGIKKVLIQTDAAINPGNSGGALLNINGELIGINAAKFSSSMVEGMGYAIPISEAKPIIDDLMNRQTREKVEFGEESYLGISGVDVTDEVSQTYNMPTGVYIAQALEGTAAEAAGLQKGDILIKFDGQRVDTMAELQEILTYYPAGTTVELVIQRPDGDEYDEVNVTVTLGSKASQQ
ncbi:MAG TPA: trypsin-like peptidase domain-containing protein [Lachnospiraceae bacterium]|nr:trypsin-like peptidase domain-containing protein [Lachnospiraceae bacterium]